MKFFKTLNGLLTKTLCVLCSLAFSLIVYANSTDISISIEEVISNPSSQPDQYGYYYYDHVPKLAVDIQLPETGPGNPIENLSDIVQLSLDIEIPNFEKYFRRDVIINEDEFLLCNNADDFSLSVVDNGVLRVQTSFSEGMTEQQQQGAYRIVPTSTSTPNSDCYQPPVMFMSTGMVVDAFTSYFEYSNNIEKCMDNTISLNNIIAKVTNAYFTLANNTIIPLTGSETSYNFELPFTTQPVLELIGDFDRSWEYVCTESDGSLTIDWPIKENYDIIELSINGGLSFDYIVDNYSYSVFNLGPADYDIIVKPYNTCPFRLDDINIADLSHEVSRSWGHATCSESDGWLALTWVKKALPEIDISIDGGVNYTTLNASDEYYRVENLHAGDYDIRVKWSYSPMACPVQLDDINIHAIGNCKTIQPTTDNMINMHPNPANHLITINFNESELSEIKVLSLNGKEIKNLSTQKTKNTVRIDIGNLTKGIYLVEILKKKGGKLNQRFVKM